jgi:hypothetical protein
LGELVRFEPKLDLTQGPCQKEAKANTGPNFQMNNSENKSLESIHCNQNIIISYVIMI